MDAAQVRDEAVRETVREEIKRANVASQAYGTVTAVSGDTATVTMDGSSDNVPCTALVPVKSGDRVVVTVIKRQPMVTGVVGAGWLPLSATNGGTGVSDPTAGRYLVGNGSSPVSLKTPAQVLSDIGALPLAGGTMTGKLSAPRMRITATTDASGTAANDVPLIIGNETATHLEFDGNEVMCKSNGTTPAPLYLNNDGGTVYANGTAVSLDGHTHDYLPLSGGTVTGNIRREDSVMDKTASSISSNRYSSFIFDDKNGQMIGMVQTVQGTSGNTYTQVLARHNVSGSDVDNYLRLYVAANGDRSVDIPDPAIWLDALGIAETENQTASLFTAGTGFTTSSLRVSKAGGICQLTLNVKSTNALTAGTSYTLGTLAAGNRPPSMVYGAVFQGGVVRLSSAGVATYIPSAAVAASTTLQMSLTYVLAN